MINGLGTEYRDAEAITGGERRMLPPGGYVCNIVGVRNNPFNPANGKGDNLEIFYDVVEGEYRGFYRDDIRLTDGWRHRFYKSYHRTPNDPEKTKKILGMFKGFLKTVDEANGTKFADMAEHGIEERELIGKQIGLVLQAEEYQSNRGDIRVRTNVYSITTPAKIREGKYTVPELKRLDRAGTGGAGPSIDAPAPEGFTFLDSDIPF